MQQLESALARARRRNELWRGVREVLAESTFASILPEIETQVSKTLEQERTCEQT